MKSGKPISKNGRVVERLKSENELNFFSKQMRISLRNCGRIDPENIDEYIAYGGYEALGKVLTEMEPEDVIKTIKDSGLRGRGGGGFPAGVKWQFAAEQQVKENMSAVMLTKETWCLYGQICTGRRSPCCHRSYGNRRLCHRI